MEESYMKIEEVIAGIMLSEEGMGMMLAEMPMIQVSESNRKELDELFRDLSRLVPIENESNNAIQESIMSIEEELFSGKEKDVMLLKRVSENIGSMLKYLVESQIQNPKTEELKVIFSEYIERREPTHLVLAQKIIKDCDFTLKAGSIFERWTQIEKSILKESRKNMCDQCSERDTCDDREV